MSNYKSNIIEWLVVISILTVLSIIGYYSLIGLINESERKQRFNTITTPQDFFAYIKDTERRYLQNNILCKKAISLKIEYFDLKDKDKRIDCFTQYNEYKDKKTKAQQKEGKEQELRDLFLK